MTALDLVSTKPAQPTTDPIIYPESDGKPMADNTKQFHQIVTIEGNLEILFADDANVFVAGDLLWYPVEGNNKIRAAPDAMVAFGRPKGHRGSYLQWREKNIPSQVIFDVLSPGNTKAEMDRKFTFYEQHGVEEYYLYDPDTGRLEGWVRTAGELTPIPAIIGWVSPRLGIRFDLEDIELRLFFPNGAPFLTFVELNEQREEAERQAWIANQARADAEERATQAEARAAAETLARQQMEAQLQAYEAKLREAGLL